MDAPSKPPRDLDALFDHHPDPDNPGWMTWNVRDQDCFNGFLGNIAIQPDADPANAGKVGWVRMTPQRRHRNLGDVLHGGTLAGFLDIALFAGSRAMGLDLGDGGVTVELNTQFVGAGQIGVPLDAKVELVRQTGSMVFLRGLAIQSVDGSEQMIGSFTGILRTRRARPQSGNQNQAKAGA